jgi:hypothetical protein
MGAHRFSWELVNGPIPNGFFACHRCDVRACVNPDHIFLGTPKDNQQDMRKKGRSTAGDRHGMAKLTAAEVRSIREEFIDKYGEQVKLAQKYGVHKATIHAIVRGVNWDCV